MPGADPIASQTAVGLKEDLTREVVDRFRSPGYLAQAAAWHLHVISTGSLARFHTGLVGCGGADYGGMSGRPGQGRRAVLAG